MLSELTKMLEWTSVFVCSESEQLTSEQYAKDEVKTVETAIKNNAKSELVHRKVDGYSITLCFSSNYNPTLAHTIRETLLDSQLLEVCRFF